MRSSGFRHHTRFHYAAIDFTPTEGALSHQFGVKTQTVVEWTGWGGASRLSRRTVQNEKGLRQGSAHCPEAPAVRSAPSEVLPNPASQRLLPRQDGLSEPRNGR